MQKKLGFVLFCMGVISIIVLSPIGPVIVLALLESIIGIPVAVVMAVIPTFFLFLVITCVVAFMMGGRSKLAFATGGIVAVTVMTAIPYVANQDLERQVRALAHQDTDAVIGGKVKRLAIIVQKQNYKQTDCDSLCLRILLNGNVDELIIATSERGFAPDLGVSGTLYRRYQSDQCPTFELGTKGLSFEPKDEQRDYRAKKADELLMLQAMNGNCFEQSVARADSADGIIVTDDYGQDNRRMRADFDLWGWDFRRHSLRLFQRQKNRFVETYRKLVVRYNPLIPVLVPTVTGTSFNGSDINETGFIRRTAVFGADRIDFSVADIIGMFLVERLRFDLTLHDDKAAQEVRTLASAALRPAIDDGARTDPAVEILFAGIARNNNASIADLDLAARLLADSRVRLPSKTALTMRYVVERRPEHIDMLASSLFARFAALAAKANAGIDGEQQDQLYRCAEAIAVLPSSSVQPRFAVVERVARSEQLRERASPLLYHVSGFGERGISLALFLIEDSWRSSDPKRRVNDAWKKPYVAGLSALCRMGEEARSALPRLEAMRARKQIAMFGGYKGLWERTLARFDGDTKKRTAYCDL